MKSFVVLLLLAVAAAGAFGNYSYDKSIKRGKMKTNFFFVAAKIESSYNGLPALLAERGKNRTRDFVRGGMSTRIVGGSAGDINAIPYIVALHVRNKNEFSIFQKCVRRS